MVTYAVDTNRQNKSSWMYTTNDTTICFVILYSLHDSSEGDWQIGQTLSRMKWLWFVQDFDLPGTSSALCSWWWYHCGWQQTLRKGSKCKQITQKSLRSNTSLAEDVKKTCMFSPDYAHLDSHSNSVYILSKARKNKLKIKLHNIYPMSYQRTTW